MKNNKNCEIDSLAEQLNAVLKIVRKNGTEKTAAQVWALQKEMEADTETPLTCTEKVVRLLIGCGHTTVWRYYRAGKINKFSNGVYDLRSVLAYLRRKNSNKSLFLTPRYCN